MRRSVYALALVGVGLLAVAPTVATSAKASTTPGLRFSHEVVVDEQRDGFEPDIQVGPGDVLYTSTPNGSSTGISWLWTSTDHGNTFHLVPGNLAASGRTITCPQGGGDTEETLDAKGDLFFSDLQNLTNLTNSVSTDGGKTFTTTCVGADNTPVDRMWYAAHGNLGDPNFRMYEEYDAVDSSANVGNELVLEASNNGLTFTPVINPNSTTSPGCIGGGIVNCVDGDEGISGNLALSPDGHVLMAHSSSDGNLAVVSRGTITGTYPVLEGTYTDAVINGSLCPDFPIDSAHLGKSEICGATNFVTIAEDSSGDYYVAFASQKKTDQNYMGSPTLVPTGPYEVYVASSADGVHWNPPVQVSKSGSNAFAWINAGSAGRVAVAWYSANETHEKPSAASFSQTLLNEELANPDPYGYLFDELNHAEFNIDVAESTNALATKPSYQVVTASEHPVKYGAICTQGTLCEVTQGDRSLGDFMQVNHDSRGALILSYVDDTSGYYAVGPTGAVGDNGPPVVIREIDGPSLLAATGDITGPGVGPGVPMGSVTDPTGDAFYSANGSLTPAGDNLDLTGASLSRDATGLVATIGVKSLASMLVNPLAGGTTGEWIMRFTTYDPGQLGNGHIYYAGMESVAGGAPRFFAGAPTRVKEVTAFGSTTSVPGSVDAATGTITIHVPFADIGNHSKPGTEFYSATAFTATAVGTIAEAPVSLFNQTDATTPFDYILPAAAKSLPAKTAGTTAPTSGTGTTATTGVGGTGATVGSTSATTAATGNTATAQAAGAVGTGSGHLPFTGFNALLMAVTALALLAAGGLLVVESRRRGGSVG